MHPPLQEAHRKPLAIARVGWRAEHRSKPIGVLGNKEHAEEIKKMGEDGENLHLWASTSEEEDVDDGGETEEGKIRKEGVKDVNKGGVVAGQTQVCVIHIRTRLRTARNAYSHPRVSSACVYPLHELCF